MNSYIRFLVGAVAGPLEKSASAYPFTAEDAMEARRQFPNLVDGLEKIAINLNTAIKSGKDLVALAQRIAGKKNSSALLKRVLANSGNSGAAGELRELVGNPNLLRNEVANLARQEGKTVDQLVQGHRQAYNSRLVANNAAKQRSLDEMNAALMDRYGFIPEGAALPKPTAAAPQAAPGTSLDFGSGRTSVHTIGQGKPFSLKDSSGTFKLAPKESPAPKVEPAPGAPKVEPTPAPEAPSPTPSAPKVETTPAPAPTPAPGAPKVEPTPTPTPEAPAPTPGAPKPGRTPEQNMDRYMSEAGFRALLGRMFGGKDYTPEEWAKLNALQRRNAILDWRGRGNAALGVGGTLGAFGLGGAMFSPGSSSSGVHQYSSRDAVG